MANKERESEFEKLLGNMQGVHSKRMNAILHTTDDEEAFAVIYFKMLEFSAPKLQRREVQVESSETTIIIEHVTTALPPNKED
tara:strand:+ start:349 stop:597 length:249 start_codon:yes stop_codon:yes gene_type:complete